MKQSTKQGVVILLLLAFLLPVLVTGIVRIRFETTYEAAGPTEPVVGMIIGGANLNTIAAELKAQPHLVGGYRYFRDSLLTKAIDYDRPDVVDLLLKLGADPDGRDANAPRTGWPPLYIAFVEEDAEATELLLNAGADIGNMNDVGICAAHIFNDVKSEKIKQLVLEHYSTEEIAKAASQEPVLILEVLPEE